MSHIKLVTSGKGGAGKSTVSVYTAAALVRRGRRTLLLEMDCGLRGLDIMLGVSDKAVFDMGDVLEGRTEPIKAIVECSYLPGLHLMPAPVRHDFQPREEDLRRLCKGLSEYYDYLIIDTPAGLGVGFNVSMSVADSAAVVVTPDPVSVRDASFVAGLLFERGIEDTKMIVNRLPQNPRRMLMRDLDEVIDRVGVQLIGVILDDTDLMAASAGGRRLDPESFAAREFWSIAARMEGCYVPLSIR